MDGPKVRRIDFSPDEFLAGTVELSDAECGLYWRLCSLIYSRGRAVSRHELRAITHSHGNTFNALLGRLIGSGKVIAKGADLVVKRCANELEKAQKRVGNARENGKKGGRPSAKSTASPNPTVSETEKLTINHQLPTTNQQSSYELLTPQSPPSQGGRRARGLKKSARTVQIEGFAYALADRARNRDC